MWIRIYAMFLFPPNLVPLSEGSCPRSGLRGVPSCCRTRLQLLELGNTSQIRQFIRNPNELHQYPQPHPATPRMGCRPTAHPVSPRPGHVWHDCWPQPRVGHHDHVPRARHPHLSFHSGGSPASCRPKSALQYASNSARSTSRFNASSTSTPRARTRVPKKPCNVKSWPCSSDITPIRLAPACLH